MSAIVVLDDKIVLVAVSDATQALLAYLHDMLNERAPEYRWVLIGTRNTVPVTAYDFRGRPDIDVLAESLWETVSAEIPAPPE